VPTIKPQCGGALSCWQNNGTLQLLTLWTDVLHHIQVTLIFNLKLNIHITILTTKNVNPFERAVECFGVYLMVISSSGYMVLRFLFVVTRFCLTWSP
jgi:hypothetical protein